MRWAAIMLLATGCASEVECEHLTQADAQAVYDATAQRWEAEVGPLEGREDLVVCTEFLQHEDDFSFRCGVVLPEGQRLLGCNWEEDGIQHVQILACEPDIIDTLGHEYAHVLLFLTEGAPDNAHERMDVWGPVAAP